MGPPSAMRHGVTSPSTYVHLPIHSGHSLLGERMEGHGEDDGGGNGAGQFGARISSDGNGMQCHQGNRRSGLQYHPSSLLWAACRRGIDMGDQKATPWESLSG